MSERAEAAEAATKTPNAEKVAANEAAAKLHADSQGHVWGWIPDGGGPLPGQQKGVNIAKDSDKISDLFVNKQYEEGAKALSKDLLQLKGDDYNSLLRETNNKDRAKLSNDPNGPGDVILIGHNDKANTWSNVQIEDRDKPSPDSPYIVIVQPGNTVEGIARQRQLDLKIANYDPDTDKEVGKVPSVSKIEADIIKKNGMTNPDQLLTGQAVFLPY